MGNILDIEANKTKGTITFSARLIGGNTLTIEKSLSGLVDMRTTPIYRGKRLRRRVIGQNILYIFSD